MLSKEEKLKYGEALRQQMKEKQEMKRNERRGPRANPAPTHTQSDRTIVPDPSIFNSKEVLQQRLQTQEYNPFGKAGGGAPNLKAHQNQSAIQNSSLLAHSPQQYQPVRELPISTMDNIPSSYVSSNHGPQIPTTQQSAPYLATYEAYNYPQSPPKHQGPVLEAQNYSQVPYQQQQYQQVQHPLQVPPRGHQQYPPQRAPYQEQIQFQANQRIPQQYQSNSRVYQQEYQPTIMQRQAPPQRQRIKTVQNEQLQQVFKKGGRNLLRLQNETMNEHLVKQKQKQEMQAFLKQQMQEAERRKQEEKDKIKREEMEEERRNRQYLERQNQRLRDEENKKIQDKQRIMQENMRNLQIKKQEEQMAKERAERQTMDRQYKRELQLQRQKQKQLAAQHQHHQHQVHKHQIQIPRNSNSSSSVSDSDSTYSKGFNTNISKDFLKRDRERDAQKGRNDKKLQQFTQQIHKMKDQILKQGEVFQKQLDKIKREAEYAQDQKRRAELEVQRLKLQLEKKNKESQLKLLQALKRNNPYAPQRMPPPEPVHYHQPQPQQYQYDSLNQLEQDQYDNRPYGIPTQAPSPKPMSKAKRRVYEQPEPEPVKLPPRPARGGKQWQKQYSLEESNIGTLEADSKKIPLNLQGPSKLSLSGIDNMGKDAYSFGKKSQSKAFRPDPVDTYGSRASKRSDKDELDRLVENKWEMSTVKEDITKQIEELLKKKDNNNFQPSQVSRLAQSRGAIPYEGPAIGTLNSNKASLVSEGTFDVDRFNNRNEARLRELKALGVETVNTNNDDDLNRLNALLNNY